MLFIRLAWRNLWRNKRRTFITTFSVMLAVMLSALTRSMQLGSYDNMIKNTAGTFSGYIQIHTKGYWNDKTLNNSLQESDSLNSAIMKHSGVEYIVPRLDSYVLAAGAKTSRAAMVVGIDPKEESHLSNPIKRLTKGNILTSANENGVVIADGLAQQLNVGLHDTLVLLGQGYHGTSAVGKYPIVGLVHLPQPDFNRVLVYMPIKQAQYFFGASGRVTALALILDKTDIVKDLTKSLKKELPDKYEVMSWQQMMPELVQAIEADNNGGIIMLLVLYMIVGFGILGTVLMMTAERRYELGVMLAVGMRRMRLGLTLLTETISMSLLGTFLGIVASLPIMWYFHLNPIYLYGSVAKGIESYGMEPILPFSVDPSILYSQAFIVFAMALLVSLYPLWYTYKLNVNSALRA